MGGRIRPLSGWPQELISLDALLAAWALPVSLPSGERGLVDVEIVKKGSDSYQDGKTRATTDVKIKTSQGDEVWVPEKDVIARKPNPEDKSG